MIEFRNVSKIYNNGTEALHKLNLKIEKGEFVFIVGSSGAGKSTFLKLIMCEERPSSGQIILDDQDVSRIKKRKIPYVRRKMGIVFQDFRLIDHMTVYDNVAFAMRAVGTSEKAVKKRVPYILGLVGLQHKAKHFPSELSGGEQQRVGLARALVNNPSMIVADEPTGNIDPALSFEIVDLLNEINRRGTTILMVTHEHSLVKHFHKRIIQIHSGEIVADTAEMQAQTQQPAARPAPPAQQLQPSRINAPNTPVQPPQNPAPNQEVQEDFTEDFSDDGEYTLAYDNGQTGYAEPTDYENEFNQTQDYGFAEIEEEYEDYGEEAYHSGEISLSHAEESPVAGSFEQEGENEVNEQ